MAKRIKDKDIKVLAEAMSPIQYRRFKKLMEGRLSTIGRKLKTRLDKSFEDAVEAPNPTYLSDEDVDAMTQEYIDMVKEKYGKAKENISKTAGTLRRASERGLRRVSDMAKRAKSRMDRDFKDACDAPNPLYWDNEDDE